MKRLLLLLLSLQVLAACNKVLDKKPTDFVEPGNYYNSESELNLALAATYDVLGNEYLYCSSLWYQLGICTDEAFYAYSSNSYSAPMFYQYDYTNVYIMGLWQQSYIGIERANLLIANINKAKMDEGKRQAILGEALFLRAFYHFLLVSNYGNVPLKLTPSADVNSVNVPATPAKEVYEKILADMKEAEGKVRTITDIGNSSRVSRTAIQGIIARVCLNMAGYPILDQSKYAEALHWTQEVMKSNEHALRTTYGATTNSAYSQIFINQSQDIYDTKECIWEADFNTNGNNTSYWEMGKLGTMNLGCNNFDTGFAGGNIKTTIKLYNLYGAGDLRRDWVIAPFYFSSSSATTAVRTNYTASNIIGREAGKWRRYYELSSPPKQQYVNGTNFPILRFADVLLMLAEADNEVNNGPTAAAYDAINQVRRRAYGLPLADVSAVADLPASLSKDQFKQAIMDERARELCFEGLRKSDLIRWGVFTQVMSAMVTEINNSNASATNKSRWITGYFTAASSPRYLLLPVPSLEINVNKALTQNPGW
ncbi:RagB/SusD family nutrient uptake outer membrane protein [Paraflavitalea soli]|uniref:RagB/SusD family nutrient uptake outer membrane protein n=1 Tax=Paraflavitalea soli TaxID=2315862 RepID=A0A3B7MJ68_9BACT|nr:RagB/SusD family nutrient uptake outer membrane protein [Paraflavitalea soli]AXY73096.1 RagB/SusD family nutrient uptake outer membrane protein [Paraflavitalea soli]